MKPIKIIFAVALVLACLLSLSACNAETVVYPTDATGDWSYSVDEGAETACLVSYLGSDADVVIPAQITGEDGKVYGVSALGEGVFLKFDADGVYTANEVVKTVAFANDCAVTDIPNRAFYMCTALNSIVFDNYIEKIGDFAFYGCKALTHVVLPSSVKSIGAYAFRECESLKDVYILGGLSAEEGELAIPAIGTKCFYMINSKSTEKDRYYLAEDFKIHVSDASAYDTAKLEEFRKSTKNDSYKCWSEYEGHFVEDVNYRGGNENE